MKKTLTTIAALCAAIIGIGTAIGQPVVGDSNSSAVPAVGGPVSSAIKRTSLTTTTDGRLNRPRLASVQPGTGKVIVVPVLTYPQNDPRSDEAIAHLLMGITNHWAGVTSNGHFAIVRDGKIGWRNLIYSQTTPTDWFVMQQVVIAKSLNETNNVSLADIRISATSTSGTLDESEYGVADGEGYGPLAFGIEADGTVIDSGPATKKCRTVVIVFQTPLYNGGATPQGVATAYTFITKQVGFSILYRAWLDGDPTSTGRTVVSLTGYSKQPASLAISKAENARLVINGNTDRLYQVLSASAVTGPWESFGSLYVGDGLVIDPTDDKKFFRAQSLP